MIEIGMDPTLVHVGGFSIRWYGLMIAVAVGVGVYISLQEAKRKGVVEDDVYTAAFWAVLAGIVGARLFHVVDQLNYYLLNPTAIIAFQQGGLAIYGAVVGGAVAVAGYALVRRMSLGRLMDVAAPGLILAQAIGRLGCIINGDAWGGPSYLPWAFIYTHRDAAIPPGLLNVPTHPAPAYEIIWDLIVFGALWKLRPRVLPDGTLFLVYAVMYSFGRFFLSFLREEDYVFLGLRQAQLIAVLAVVGGGLLLAYLLRRRSALQVKKA